MSTYDVAIIGGGPAGLSAGLVLARARWKVVVFDAGTPRNVASPAVHGFLSRDGTPPSELKRISRMQIEAYGAVEFSAARVTAVEPRADAGQFMVRTEGGEPAESTLVLIATGMVDEHPAIEGFADHWGHRIIHCAYCHGWENADRPWGIVAQSLEEAEGAPGFSPWTDDILVFADPGLELPDKTRRDLEAKGIRVEQRPIRRVITSSDGDLAGVELVGGERIARGTLVYRPKQRQSGLVLSVGVDLDKDGFVKVDENRQTSVPGIYAGGDLAMRCQDALSAAAAGAAIGKRMTRVLLERRGDYKT
jgi:thioredoxin reductase